MTSTAYKNNIVKLCTLGDGGAGKTSVTIQYIHHHFVDYYDPTIEDSYRRQTMIDGKVYMLDILDTAGQDELTAMRDQWIRSCEGFILVYSVTSRSSFDQIINFREQILRVLDKDDVPILMVGNKIDLVDERQVSTQEGKDLASCLKMSFLEVSAKTRENIDETFNTIVRQVKSKELEAEKRLKGHYESNKKKSIKRIFNGAKSSICKVM